MKFTWYKKEKNNISCRVPSPVCSSVYRGKYQLFLSLQVLCKLSGKDFLYSMCYLIDGWTYDGFTLCRIKKKICSTKTVLLHWNKWKSQKKDDENGVFHKYFLYNEHIDLHSFFSYKTILWCNVSLYIIMRLRKHIHIYV